MTEETFRVTDDGCSQWTSAIGGFGDLILRLGDATSPFKWDEKVQIVITRADALQEPESAEE